MSNSNWKMVYLQFLFFASFVFNTCVNAMKKLKEQSLYVKVIIITKTFLSIQLA